MPGHGPNPPSLNWDETTLLSVRAFESFALPFLWALLKGKEKQDNLLVLFVQFCQTSSMTKGGGGVR